MGKLIGRVLTADFNGRFGLITSERALLGQADIEETSFVRVLLHLAMVMLCSNTQTYSHLSPKHQCTNLHAPRMQVHGSLHVSAVHIYTHKHMMRLGHLHLHFIHRHICAQSYLKWAVSVRIRFHQNRSLQTLLGE